MNPEKQALAAVWAHKKFYLLQTLGIAAWLALVLTWFWLPDSRAWGIALSAIQGAAVIAGGLWLMGAALSFYGKAHAGVDPGPIWRDGLRTVPALLVWLAVLALTIWASMRPKAPAWIWIVPAILLLPLAAQVTWEGVRGLFRPCLKTRYFPAAIVLIAAGAYVPYKLIDWHPQLGGIAMQTASLTVRFLVAYLLAVSAWLIMASLLGRLAVPAESR